MKKILLLSAGTMLLAALESCSDQRSVTLSLVPPPPDVVTYDGTMKALFDGSCIICHSPSGGMPNGYRLDNYLGVLGNGGDATPNAIPGDSTSLIIIKVKNRSHFAWNTAADQNKIDLLIQWVVVDSCREN